MEPSPEQKRKEEEATARYESFMRSRTEPTKARHFFCIGWRPSGAQKPLVYYEALYEDRSDAEAIVNEMQRGDPSHVFFVDVPANICMCPKCKGSGKRGKHACNHCHGIGLVGA